VGTDDTETDTEGAWSFQAAHAASTQERKLTLNHRQQWAGPAPIICFYAIPKGKRYALFLELL
jgi:hypothetical protein